MKKKIFVLFIALVTFGILSSMTYYSGEPYYTKCTVIQHNDGYVELLFDENVIYLGDNYRQLIMSDYHRPKFPTGYDAVGHLTAKWGWKQIGNTYVNNEGKLCWDLQHEVSNISTFKRDVEAIKKRFPDFDKH